MAQQQPLGEAAGALSAIAPELFRGKIDQVCFLVEDLESAKQTWGLLYPDEEWLGRLIRADDLASATYRGEPGTYVMDLALIGRSPQLELIQPISGPSIYHDWVEEHGYGLHHFGFYADDVAATVARIEAAGLRQVFSGTGVRPDGSGAFAYFEISEDFPILVEVIEPKRTGSADGTGSSSQGT